VNAGHIISIVNIVPSDPFTLIFLLCSSRKFPHQYNALTFNVLWFKCLKDILDQLRQVAFVSSGSRNKNKENL